MTNKKDQRPNENTEPVGVIEESGTPVSEQPDLPLHKPGLKLLKPLLRPAFLALAVALLASLHVFFNVTPQWLEQKTTYQVFTSEAGELFYSHQGDEILIDPGRRLRFDRSF